MGNSAFVLGQWTTFYTLTGSAAATLTGLMFVVITLVARRERSQNRIDGMATFTTPTVIYFGVALFVSIVLCAPWHSVIVPAFMTGIAGLAGVVHMVRVLGRARRLTEYNPDLEDWSFYTILPLIAYLAILAGALLRFAPAFALDGLAAGVVLMIFIGIHNAWDIVTYLTVIGPHEF
jgi:hypothetical protein